MERRPAAQALADNRDFHSVTVVTGGRACAAAVAISGQRIIAKDAPLLPLDACTNIESCNCIYLHHDDRRHLDRREDFLLSHIVEVDRRDTRERRKDATWRQYDGEPTVEDVKNATRSIQALVERLLEGDQDVNLDDLYLALDHLREDVEFRVLLDSVDAKAS